MLVIQIALGILLLSALLVLIMYWLEPSLLALPFSFLLRLSFRNPPIVDVDTYFPNHVLLQQNWQTIKEELHGVLQQEEQIPQFHEVDAIQRFISAKDEVPWRTFIFKAYENWMDANCEQAPQTAALLKQLPQVTTAMFSILGPQKRIPPHRGFYKGIWRYHLGLVVPKEGDCYIINGGRKYYWKEGEGVLFDDTFRHEVWNKSNETRAVLFCDVYRTDLPAIFQSLNRWVFRQRVRSKRLKKAIARAEVMQDL